MRNKKVWNGEYRGVFYEISHHGISDYQPQGVWCYYIYIHEKQIQDKDMDKFNLPNYDYYTPFWNSLDWHCGMTYYSKEYGADGNPLIFKAGCDYNHYWDEGYQYSESLLEVDAKNTIDKLLEQVTLKIRCLWDGCYDLPDNCVAHGDGYINKNCIQARNEGLPKAEQITADAA